MVVLLVVATWLALDWKGERDRYQQAYARDNWRVRYTEQANPDYYAYMEGIFSKEPAKVHQWVEEQEQADQKRALAKEAVGQAKALSEQANQLEGKARTKGKKKANAPAQSAERNLTIYTDFACLAFSMAITSAKVMYGP